jgi:hypothetical protein
MIVGNVKPIPSAFKKALLFCGFDLTNSDARV